MGVHGKYTHKLILVCKSNNTILEINCNVTIAHYIINCFAMQCLNNINSGITMILTPCEWFHMLRMHDCINVCVWWHWCCVYWPPARTIHDIVYLSMARVARSVWLCISY